MKNRNYLQIISASKSIADENLLSYLRYELDHHVYYYGAHFRSPFEKHSLLMKNMLAAARASISFLKNTRFKRKKNHNTMVLCNAYSDLNSRLLCAEIEPIRLPWARTANAHPFPCITTNFQAAKIIYTLRAKPFRILIEAGFTQALEVFQRLFEKACSSENIKGLILANDMGVFERLSIASFKKIRKPSFVVLHGLPARYNTIDDNQADYLIVWGERLKDHYVAQGVPPEKIFVAGHPRLSGKKIDNELRFSLENILILTMSINGAPHSDGLVLSDRGSLIAYLYEIQNALKTFGVKRARLRVHPSENSDWYLQFIDSNFFQIDKNPLVSSLRESSLVIGPSSTVLLESLAEGVNFVLFEPSQDRILNSLNYRLVPPFDDSEARIPLACNQTELIAIIANKQRIDSSVYDDYIKPEFDIRFLEKILK